MRTRAWALNHHRIAQRKIYPKVQRWEVRAFWGKWQSIWMGQSLHEGALEANGSEEVICRMMKNLCTLLKFLLNPESNWSHESLYTQAQIYVSGRWPTAQYRMDCRGVSEQETSENSQIAVQVINGEGPDKGNRNRKGGKENNRSYLSDKIYRTGRETGWM